MLTGKKRRKKGIEGNGNGRKYKTGGERTDGGEETAGENIKSQKKKRNGRSERRRKEEMCGDRNDG